jgi:hypothetical protein
MGWEIFGKAVLWLIYMAFTGIIFWGFVDGSTDDTVMAFCGWLVLVIVGFGIVIAIPMGVLE